LHDSDFPLLSLVVAILPGTSDNKLLLFCTPVIVSREIDRETEIEIGGLIDRSVGGVGWLAAAI